MIEIGNRALDARWRGFSKCACRHARMSCVVMNYTSQAESRPFVPWCGQEARARIQRVGPLSVAMLRRSWQSTSTARCVQYGRWVLSVHLGDAVLAESYRCSDSSLTRMLPVACSCMRRVLTQGYITPSPDRREVYSETNLRHYAGQQVGLYRL